MYIHTYTHIYIYIDVYVDTYVFLYIYTHTNSYTETFIGCKDTPGQQQLERTACNQVVGAGGLLGPSALSISLHTAELLLVRLHSKGEAAASDSRQRQLLLLRGDRRCSDEANHSQTAAHAAAVQLKGRPRGCSSGDRSIPSEALCSVPRQAIVQMLQAKQLVTEASKAL